MARKRYDESKITQEMRDVLKATYFKSGSARQVEEAKELLASMLGDQLRMGIFPGDITSDIFTKNTFQPGIAIEYPLDPIAPGTEKDYVAYTVPRVGMIPNKYIEGDYLMVPTYVVGNGIDWSEKYARDARWDVVARAMEILEAGFIKKRNDDAWHLLMAAGVDRNVVVYDSDAIQGQFSKRLISLMKVVMRRNGGGNSTSVERFKLTDMFISPEGIEDMRNWNLDQVDEFTRRDIFLAEDGSFNRIFSVNLHDIDELGEDQEYQNFYQTDLGGVLQGSDVELILGLDLETVDAFKNPILEEVSLRPDDSLRRARKQGWWGEGEHGFAITDNRPIILGSY